MVVEVAHWFEIELNVLVVENHRLAVEGIRKLEEDQPDDIRHALDSEYAESTIQFHDSYFYDLMRRAATHLAVAGLVARFDHWVGEFVRLARKPAPKANRAPNASKPKRKPSHLVQNLERLNGSDVPPVPVRFFEELEIARNSAIHGDSKAEWGRGGDHRGVAKKYRNGTRLEVTDEQLKEAIESAIKQVKWYDGKFPGSRGYEWA